jgi:hypothetical protein
MTQEEEEDKIKLSLAEAQALNALRLAASSLEVLYEYKELQNRGRIEDFKYSDWYYLVSIAAHIDFLHDDVRDFLGGKSKFIYGEEKKAEEDNGEEGSGLD